MMELEGSQFEIIPDEANSGIQVRATKNGKTQVVAHPQTPQQELIVYLKKYIKANEKHIAPPELPGEHMTIRVFDELYTTRIDPYARRPYIRDKAIYTHAPHNSEKQIQQLKNHLLQTQLMLLVGAWEERLDFLLVDVTLKTLPKRLFIAYRGESKIVFSKKLTDTTLEMMNFVVANSIFYYLQLPEQQAITLYERYVPNWKHCLRVFEHERMLTTK